MAETNEFNDGWWQQQIIPSTVYEATLRIGTVSSSDHGQLQIEITDPTTGILIGLKSWPHVPLRNVELRAADALAELVTQLRAAGGLGDPFPGPAPG